MKVGDDFFQNEEFIQSDPEQKDEELATAPSWNASLSLQNRFTAVTTVDLGTVQLSSGLHIADSETSQGSWACQAFRVRRTDGYWFPGRVPMLWFSRRKRSGFYMAIKSKVFCRLRKGASPSRAVCVSVFVVQGSKKWG